MDGLCVICICMYDYAFPQIFAVQKVFIASTRGKIASSIC